MFARHSSLRAASHRHGSTRVSTRHDVQQPPGVDIDDRRRPPLTAPRALPHEQGLVQPKRGGLTDPVGVLDQRRCRRRSRRRSRCASHSPARRRPRSRCDPSGPTCSVTHRPARSVNASRGAAMAGSSAGPRPHRAARAGGTPSDACATPAGPGGRTPADPPAPPPGDPSPPAADPHRRHDGRASRDSMWTRNGPTGRSTTPSTFTSGRPTSSSHMRVVLVGWTVGEEGRDVIRPRGARRRER